jgi:uracil phosphoribosyltransferase
MDNCYTENNAVLEHHYGPNVHIFQDRYSLSLLERLSSPEISQPIFNQLVSKLSLKLYEHICNTCLDDTLVKSKTRMAEYNEEGIFVGNVIDPEQKVVTVDLARAGMVPSQVIFDNLSYLINIEHLRQDHIYAARVSDENGKVTGTSFAGSKIGGDIHRASVIFPDPMGATGSTIVEAISHYKQKVEGTAKRFICAHLIITPEYIKNVLAAHPDAIIIALRLDRGLSSTHVLSTTPGSEWDQEKGLNDSSYIVPGAGGVGELINNSFV